MWKPYNSRPTEVGARFCIAWYNTGIVETAAVYVHAIKGVVWAANHNAIRVNPSAWAPLPIEWIITIAPEGTEEVKVIAYDEEEARDLATKPGWKIVDIEERIR